MRKSFTRLFGLFVLFSMLSWQVAAQVSYTLSPEDHSVTTEKGMSTFQVEFPAGTTIEANSGAGIISLNEYDGGPVELQPKQVTFGSASQFIDGNVITVTFDSQLLEEQAWYYITISPDAFLVDDEPWDGITANPVGEPSVNDGLYVWDFQVGDFSAPALVSLFPPDNSINAGNQGTGNTPNTDLVLEFEEPVRIVGGGTIALYNANGNAVDYIELDYMPALPWNTGVSNSGATSATVSLSVDRKTITVTDVNDLEPLTEYYVRISEGSIVDDAGNDVTEVLGTNDNTTWNFVAADNEAPEMTSDIDGQTDVAQEGEINFTITDDFALEFNGATFNFVAQTTTSLYDEEHTIASGDIDPLAKADLSGLFTLTGGSGVGSLDFANATVSADGTEITVPYEDLETHIDYTITTTASVVDDGSGNTLPVTTFTFTTGDFTAPIVESAALLQNSVTRNADDNQNLDVTVAHTMINDQDDPDQSGDYTAMYSEPLFLYMKVVDFDQTVADMEAPTDVVAEGWTQVPYDYDNDEYSLENHDFGLECDKVYDIYFFATDSATSASGFNSFDDAAVQSTQIDDFWSTDDCVAFPAMTFSDDSEADEVGMNADIILTFEEDMAAVNAVDWSDAITLTVPNGTLDDGSDDDPDPVAFTATWNAADSTLTINETQGDQYEGTTLNDYAALLSNATYTLTINEDEISDVINEGNGTANLLGEKVYTFTTEDYEGPIATFVPEQGEGTGNPTIVSVTPEMTVTFNEVPYINGSLLENADAKQYIKLRKGTTELANEVTTGYSVTVSGNVATVELAAGTELDSETNYRLSVSPLITDENGFFIFGYEDETEGNPLTSRNGTYIETYGTTSFYSVFETEDKEDAVVTIVSVQEVDNDNDATNDTESTTDIDQDGLIRIEISEAIFEIASHTAIDVTDPNMVRSLITVTSNKEGNTPAEDGTIEFDIVDIINPGIDSGDPVADAGSNNNSTYIYIDPIDYNADPEFLFVKDEVITVSITGIEDDNKNSVDATADLTAQQTIFTPTISANIDVAIENGGRIQLEDASFTINFGRAVTATTNNIALEFYDGATWVNVATIAANTAIISGNSTEFTYNYGGTLNSDTEYRVVVPQDSYYWTDDNSILWPTAADVTDENNIVEFTTVDETAPTIELTDGTLVYTESGIPASDQSTYGWLENTPFDDVVNLVFSEPVVVGSGDVKVFRIDGASSTEVYSMTASGILSDDGDETLQIPLPAAVLEGEWGKDFFIEIAGSVITDEAGNEFVYTVSNAPATEVEGGISGDVLQFTTWADTPDVFYADLDPTAEEGWYPATESEDVDEDVLNGGYLVIPFTGKVAVTTATDITYRIIISDNASGGTTFGQVAAPIRTPGLIDLVEGGTKAQVNLDVLFSNEIVEFEPEIRYTVEITPGSFVKDSGTSSNMVVATTNGTAAYSYALGESTYGVDGWYFTTEDTVDPMIADVTWNSVNTDGTVDHNSSVTITFTEEVKLSGETDWADVFTFDANTNVSGFTFTGTDTGIDSDTEDGFITEITLTLDPNTFETDHDFRTVTFVVPAGAFEDNSPSANTNNASTVAADLFVDTDDATFEVEDNRKPIPQIVSVPADGTEGIEPTIEVEVDEAATVYVLAQVAGTTPAPAEADVLASEFVVGVDANTATELTITGLEECTDYDFYVMAVDSSVNANISDDAATTGNQAVKYVSSYKTGDVTAPFVDSMYPQNDETIEMYTVRYPEETTTPNDMATPLKLYFNEKIDLVGTSSDVAVREYETNVAIDVDVTVDGDTALVIVPTLGHWAANTHYYVETNYGIINNDPNCNVGDPIDWAEAFYGKDEWHFHTGDDYDRPEFVELVYPVDGDEQVIFTQPDTMVIEYTEDVAINYGIGNVYIYRYDDLGANAQEVIPVTASNVWADGEFVYIRVAHLLNNNYKEHYRVVLADSTVIDPNRTLADATTRLDYTPLHANSNGDISYDLTSTDDTHADGPFWDFWALDVASPDLFWTSMWVNEFEGNRYYVTEDDRLANFPTRDHNSANDGPNADNSDTEVGNTDDYPDRTIYLNFNEKLYYYIDADTDPSPADALANGDNLEDFFAASYIDEEGDTIELDKATDFDVEYELADNRAVFTFNDDLIGSSDYTIALLDERFTDVHNNVLGEEEGSEAYPYEFTTWLDESPTVSFAATQSANTIEAGNDRTSSQPEITVTFNRPVLIADIYQPLLDEDVLDLFSLVVKGTTTPIELTIVENSKEDVYTLQPADVLDSEEEYVFTVLSDGVLDDTGMGGTDIDLVDNVRTYTENGNIFDQPLADRQFEFTVEDYEAPTNATAVFHPNAATDVMPTDPMGAFPTTGGFVDGNYIAVEFAEDVMLGGTPEPIVIRRAYASGPQSEGAGTIFQRTYINDLTASNIEDNVLYLPVTGGVDSLLESFTGYYVNIPADFIQDMAGLSYAGIETGNKTTWAFSTDDGTEPRVISAYPQIWDESMYAFDAEDRDDAFAPENVSKNVNFRLKFDENIVRGTGNIVLYKRNFDFSTNEDGNVVDYIPVTDPVNVLIEGSDPNNGLTSDVMVIKHSSLEASMNYYVRYEAGIVEDAQGNKIAARNVAGDFTWDFNTSDHDIPVIADLDPNDGEIVSQEPVLTMTFEEDVPVQLGSGNLRIYEYFYVDGTVWDSRLITTIDITDENQVTLIDSANAVMIDPMAKLPDNGSKLYVLVDASAVTNTTTLDQFDGIADEDIWFFGTEADSVAPAFDTVTTNVACDVAPGEIAATIELTDFNGIAAGSGNFEVYYAADSTLAFEVPAIDPRVAFVNEADDYNYITESTATITFDAADLEEETAYYVVVGDSAIFDNSNADEPNVFDGSIVEDWAFIVNDFSAPVATLDMDTDFTASDSLVVTIKFNEEVQVGSAPDFVVATAADSAEVFTYTITEENINNEDSTVTIIVNGLDDMTDYYMAYDSSFVNDMAFGDCPDVRAVEALDANTWTFNTGDNTAPTAVIDSPVLVETHDTVLVITFSEPVNVDELEGYVVVDGDSVLMTSEDSLTYSGIMQDLPSDATVEVVFPEGSFEDVEVGGTTNAIAAGTVLTFEVDDIAAPVAQYMPYGIYEDYYKDIELRMAFDDNVAPVADMNVYLFDADTDEAIDTIAATDFATSDDTTFTFTTDLYYGSFYVLADYGSFVDDEATTIAQNYEGITADTVWAFDIVDTYFDPCVDGFNPLRSAKDVETTTTISLNFCGEEAISGPIRDDRFISIGDQSEEQVEGVNYFNFEVADSMINGTTLTLEVHGLNENTTYSITIAEGAVTDEAENEFEGITNANDWIFTTGDFTEPVATLVAGQSVEGEDADATMATTENGTLYLVEEGVAAEVAVMDAAIDNNTAIKTPAMSDVNVMVDVSGLVPGNYNAVAVDTKGNVSVKSDNVYVIEEAPNYPVLTIAEIQGTGDETPYDDQIVVTSGTVTGVDESGDGFFMQDANEARSGIYVYDADLAANVGIGTSVKVTATATEYFTLTQLTDVIAYEFTAKVVEPVAIDITAAEVDEDYEGVLVKVDSLKTTDLPDQHDEWMTKDTENDVDVKIDDQLFTFVPDAGQRYNITGVCNYTHEEYKLAPTQVEDIDFVSGIKMLDINIDIYPNPFDTYVKFDVSRDVEITKAVITNIAGQLVKQVDYPANTIQTDELRSGVYFISLQTEKGIAKTERIIKR